MDDNLMRKCSKIGRGAAKLIHVFHHRDPTHSLDMHHRLLGIDALNHHDTK